MTSPGCAVMVWVLWAALSHWALAQAEDLHPSPQPLTIYSDETVSHIIVNGQPLHVLGKVDGNILVLGSDATIEGRVEGDAIAIGGTVTQRQGGYIGGDVLIIGGQYKRAPDALPRQPKTQTLIITDLHDELRSALHNPWKTLFFPPSIPIYLGLRALGVLLYFLVALLLIALIPSQLTRAIQALRQTYLRMSLVGLLVLSLFLLFILLVVRFLPIEVALMMTFFAGIFYVGVALFGSLTVHLLVGRWIQQWIRRGRDHSNINALLYGLGLTAVLFSIPVINILCRIGLVILSFGIAATLPFIPSDNSGK